MDQKEMVWPDTGTHEEDRKELARIEKERP
jgi:hypothetical protein